MKNTQVKWFIFAACFLLMGTIAFAQGRAPKQAGLPDLAITSLQVVNWQNCQTEMNIANTGEADSGKFEVRLEAFYNNQWQILGLWNYDSIPAGGSAPKIAAFTPDQIQIILKSTKLKATIDPNDKLNEKSKTNNAFELSISPPKADLTITSMQLTDFNKGKVMVGVSNLGDAVSNGATLKIDALSNSQWVDLGYYNFPALQAGQSQNFLITLDEQAKQKLFTATKLKGYIDFYTNVDEKNENNNAFEIALIPPKPDLVITGMKVLNWQNCQTEITIANTGEMDWGTFNIKVEAFCDNQWQILGTSWPSYAVAAGQTTSAIIGYNESQVQVILKSTKLRAMLDPENKIGEKNEANNIFEIPLNPPKPDLVVTDMKIFSWEYWATKVTIANVGEVDSGKFNLKVEAFCNNQWQTAGTWPCGSIKAGQTAENNLGFPPEIITQILVKSTKLRVTLDSNNEVFEKNEANNSFEIPILYPKPDLSIINMKVANWQFCDLEMNMTNTGDADSGKFEVKIEALQNNQWQFLGVWTLDSIPAGQTHLRVAGFTEVERKIILKSTKIKVSIDPNNKLIEKNKNNNVFEIPIFPPNADLMVTNIQITNWEKGALLVSVTNAGDIDSVDTTLKLEVFLSNQWQELTYNNYPPVAAGQTKNVVVGINAQQKEKLAGSTKIKAHIDFYANVPEKNENNNSLEKNVIVTVNIQ